MPKSSLVWGMLALLAGLMVAALPFKLALALAGLLSVCLMVFLEPALGFVIMLAVAPLRTLLETEHVWTLPGDVGQLAFVAAVGIWVVHKSVHRDTLRNLRGSPLLPALFLYLLVTGLSLPAAYSLGDGLSEWVKWAEITLLVIIILDYAADRWEWLVFGVVLAALIQALIGLYEFSGGSGAGHLWILDFQYFRAFGSFGQPNPFGGFMGLVLPLAVGTGWGYAVSAFSMWRRSSPALIDWRLPAVLAAGYGVFAIIILAGLVASWSRGAWSGFGVAMLTVIWLAPQRRMIGTLALVIVLVGAGVFYIEGVVPQSIVDRGLSFSREFAGFQDVRGAFVDDNNFAVVERLAHWQAALDMASSRPWFGVGFGNYEAAYPDFRLPHWPLALGHAHNYYLNVLGETGIVGLVAYIILWLFVVGLTWQTLRYTTGLERGIVVGLMGTWMHLSFHSLVDKLYVNNVFLHIGVMLGLLAVIHYRSVFHFVPPSTKPVRSKGRRQAPEQLIT